MAFPKSFASARPLSQVAAIILFVNLPLIVFWFGMYEQKKSSTLNMRNSDTNVESIHQPVLEPTLIPTTTPALSPNIPGWYRYMSPTLDYYVDYPKTYSYGSSMKNEVSFEKQVNYPHRTSYYIFIEKGEAIRESKEKLLELGQMEIGEKKVVTKTESPLPSEYKTYKRLPDVYFGQKKAMAFIQETVWEASKNTRLYTYIYEGKDTYVFGGLTNDTEESEDAISYAEFREIISTLRFLD